MDKASLTFVSVFVVILLIAQNVELVRDVFYENGDDFRSSSWLDKTYYQDYQDYEYQDEQVSSLSLTLKLLPLIVINIVLFLVLFLAAVTTTATNGKRKRSVLLDDNFGQDADKVLLDGPTWLSMVHELWEQDAALENTVCTQETLCRMNRLAMAAPGQAGWAVSLSSLPLSYLLHTRHTGGFSSYMDAALMGRSGANCTELYASCPRLSY